MDKVYVMVEDLELTSRKVLEQWHIKKDIISVDELISYLENRIDELEYEAQEEYYPDPYDEWHDNKLLEEN